MGLCWCWKSVTQWYQLFHSAIFTESFLYKLRCLFLPLHQVLRRLRIDSRRGGKKGKRGMIRRNPMGWLRSVGSIKLYFSFAEYRLFYRSLLPKRPIILSILLVKASPYHIWRSLYRVLYWLRIDNRQGGKNCQTPYYMKGSWYEVVLSHMKKSLSGPLLTENLTVDRVARTVRLPTIWRSLLWRNHRMKESCHTFEGQNWQGPYYYEGVITKGVMIWRSHATGMKGSCLTHEGVMSQIRIWRSHITHMKESRDTYEGVILHT